MSARLPTVNGDDGNWGQILNDFLSVEHGSDGFLKDLIKPEKYGAVGDGVTDDSAALQAAINAAVATNGTVTLASKVYNLKTTGLTVNGICRIIGQGTRNYVGSAGTVLLYSGSGTALWLNSGSSPGSLNLTLEAFSIIGSGSANYGLALGQDTASPFTGAASVRDVSVKGFTVAGIRLIYTAYAYFERIDCTNNGGDGLVIDSVDNDGNNIAAFTACRFTGNTGRGVFIKQGVVITFRSCSFESNDLEGCLVQKQNDAEALRSITWDDCYWESNNFGRSAGGYGQLAFANLGTTTIPGMRIRGGKFSGPESNNNIVIDSATVYIDDVDHIAGTSTISNSSKSIVTIRGNEDPTVTWTVAGGSAEVSWEIARNSTLTWYANVGGTPTSVISINRTTGVFTGGGGGGVPAGSVAQIFFRSGKYIAPFGGITTSSGVAANSLRAMPIYVAAGCTAVTIGAEVTTIGSSGSVIRLGIYNDDGTGKPGTLVLDAGTIDGTTTNSGLPQEITISQVLAAGNYWLASVPQGSPVTPPTMRCKNSGSVQMLGSSTVEASQVAQTAYSQSTVTGALSTFSASPGIVSLAPVVFIKVT